MLTESFIDNSDPSGFLPEDRVLFDLFERALEHGRITEFVNLQTGERVDNRYILEQVRQMAAKGGLRQSSKHFITT